MGEDGARGKDWLRARGHHLCLTDTIFVVSPAKQKRDICIAFPASSLSSSLVAAA